MAHRAVEFVFQGWDGLIYGDVMVWTPQVAGKRNARNRMDGVKGRWIEKSCLTEADLAKQSGGLVGFMSKFKTCNLPAVPPTADLTPDQMTAAEYMKPTNLADLYKAVTELEGELDSLDDASSFDANVIMPLTTQVHQLIGAIRGARNYGK
jgi:hypothetical protein